MALKGRFAPSLLDLSTTDAHGARRAAPVVLAAGRHIGRIQPEHGARLEIADRSVNRRVAER